jgi:hypothetical protein
MLIQVIVESLVGPLFGALSRAVGEPVPMYPFTMLAGCIGGCWVGWRYQFAASPSALGVDAALWRSRRLLLGAALGTAAILSTAGLLWATGHLRLTPMAAMEGMVADSWGSTALRLFVLLAPSALWEELAFRSYLPAVALEAAGNAPSGPLIARLTASVAFGAIHLSNPGAGLQTTAIVMLAGWCLALLRERSGLPAAWTAHLAWNWVMAAVLHVPVSGLPFATPGYRAILSGPAWLSGGDWGPEGSVMAALVLGAAALAAHPKSPKFPSSESPSSLARS